VFHDLGNVNFSFIDFGKSDSLVNFKKYSKPVLDYLEQYNVKAKLIGKSDLKIGDHKISGNASHVYRNKVLHHGTILYDSNLKHLYNALRIFDNKIVDKSINSNRTQVTNVKEHMENPIDVKTFIKNFYRFIKNRYKNIEEAELTKLQVKEIGALVRDKYKSWDWNFAYSPKYTIGGDLKISNREYKIEFIVVKGFIADYSLKKISSGFSKTIHNMLENEAQIIKGIPHNVDILSKHLGAMKDKTLANQLYEILVSV
jgi:lipoate-protein ligase A